MSTGAARRWARRAMLSALAGGGLTAVGLGGPLAGGALGAETPTGSTGAGEDTPPPATGTAPAPPTPSPPSGSGEPATATSTSPAPSTTSPAPPAATPTPAAPPAPAGTNGAAGGPTVVVQRTQGAAPGPARRKGTKTGSGTPARGGAGTRAAAKGSGGAEAKATTPANGPSTVPPGTPNGVAPAPQLVAAQAGTLASVLGQSAVSAQALDYYRIPLFLLPIYQAAGIQYGVPWQILAAINEVETDYGSDQAVSTAGAVGWMQFMPTTWLQYGVDALGAGYADPYNPVDAIFAAARYLHAAGAASNLHTAILAYNHSEAYVSSVLLRAKLIAAYPQSVIATLTGLTEGRLPVAGARVAQDPGSPLSTVTNATAGAVALAPYGTVAASAEGGATGTAATTLGSGAAPDAPVAPPNPALPSPTPPPAPAVVGRKGAHAHAETLRFVELLGIPDAPVTAVEDGRVVKLGRSRKLGNYLALRDVYGDVFTYAGLGSIAPRYHVAAHRRRAKRGSGVGGASGAFAHSTAAASRLPASAAAASAVGRAATPAPAAGDSVPTVSRVHDPAPTRAASAGRQLPLTLHVKTPRPPRAATVEVPTPPAETGGERDGAAAAPPPGMGRGRLFAHPDNPVAHAAAARAAAQSGQSDGHGGRWLPLKLGSVVSQGTVLGHLSAHANAGDAQAGAAQTGTAGTGAAQTETAPAGAAQAGAAQAETAQAGTAQASAIQAGAPASAWNHVTLPLNGQPGQLNVPVSAQSARLRFAIRPAGDSTTVDPRPILANWRQLDTALHPQGAKGTVDLLGATVAQVFLMSQGELERTVLSDPGIDIYACGRQDIAAGTIDGRVLAVLEFLSRSGLKPTVSALRCGHGEYTTSGNVSEHFFGDAVDISAINGVPIAGHQGAGSIADVTIRALLTLQGRFVAHQIISLMQYPEAANTLALPDHWNHIHVGFHPLPGALPSTGSSVSSPTAAAAHSAASGQTAPSPLAVSGDLSPAQWEQLVARIGALPAPMLATKPTSSAIRDPQAAAGNRDLGAGALPSGGGEEE